MQQVFLNIKINQPPASEGRKEGSRKFQDVLSRVTTDNPNGLVRFIAHSGMDDMNGFICGKGDCKMLGWKNKFFSEKKKATAGIEELAPGKSLIYRLPELYHGGLGAFAVIELNPDFPKNGRKFNISADMAENGNPKGQKIRHWDTNNPGQIIDWLKDKNATPFN